MNEERHVRSGLCEGVIRRAWDDFRLNHPTVEASDLSDTTGSTIFNRQNLDGSICSHQQDIHTRPRGL
jgi:hypothetical protein